MIGIILRFKMITMEVRWRQQEFILVTLIAGILFSSYLWDIYRSVPGQFAAPFIANNVPFNLFKNVIIPQLGAGLLIYLAYCWVTLYTIPRFLSPQKTEAGSLTVSASRAKISFRGIVRKMIRKYLWLLIQLLLIIAAVGTALNFSIYYLHQWQFSYPGFSIFGSNSEKSQIYILGGYLIVALMIGGYGLYVCIREFIIHLIESSGGKRAYRTVIVNQILVFGVIYFSVLSFLASFDLVHEDHFALSYFAFLTPVFSLYLSNVYWLFPAKKEGSLLDPVFVRRLLLSSFGYSLPFFVFLADRSQPAGFFIGYWFCQVFITTPVTWLLFQKRKDEILLLKGAAKEISKSKTDLQFLRSQINPHFLFNVLNTLYGTALQENAERTAGGIQKLGDMMRFMLHENNQDRIDMTKEIDYLRNYIALQKLRIQASEEIQIEDDIDARACNHRIAPMLLIPLVENAFKHGVSLKEKSWIKIALHCDEKSIFFSVHNSMHPKKESDPENQRSGIGLKNVMERLKLIYPGRFQAAVNGDGKEFFVELTIQPASA